MNETGDWSWISNIISAIIGAIGAFLLFGMESRRIVKHQKKDIFLTNQLSAMKDFLWQAERIVIHYTEKNTEYLHGFQTTYDQFSVLFGSHQKEVRERCYNAVLHLYEAPVEDKENFIANAKNGINDLRESIIDYFEKLNKKI